MKKIISILSVVAIGVLTLGLGGCASIVSGEHQSVSVETPCVPGATCSLKNDKGVWFVSNTPGSVMVHRSFCDLDVSCKKKGYQDADIKVKSHTKKMAFGNALFGGVIGAGVDMADGAAYSYPNDIQVPMKRKK